MVRSEHVRSFFVITQSEVNVPGSVWWNGGGPGCPRQVHREGPGPHQRVDLPAGQVPQARGQPGVSSNYFLKERFYFQIFPQKFSEK